jgi:hypothetical protein
MGPWTKACSNARAAWLIFVFRVFVPVNGASGLGITKLDSGETPTRGHLPRNFAMMKITTAPVRPPPQRIAGGGDSWEEDNEIIHGGDGLADYFLFFREA